MIRNNKFFVKKYDEDENKITLEEERKYHSPFVLFLIKNGRLLLAISLLLSVSVFIIAITLIFGNMKESSIVMYEQNGVVVSFDGDDNSIVNGTPITKEYAEKVFDSNLIQDNNLRGVVIKLKEVSIKDKNKGKVKGVITFYSDRTAIVKYDDGSYKRIYSVNGNYGITESGVIDSKAITNDLSGEYKKNDKYNINLIYLSDGSVIVIKDKVELFVRNSDITSNDDEFFTTLSGVSTPISKDGNKYTYSDGTIKENDYIIVDDIKYTKVDKKKTEDNIKIIYYDNGYAEIIYNNLNVMVKNSEHIRYNDNIFEIIDNDKKDVIEIKDIMDIKDIKLENKNNTVSNYMIVLEESNNYDKYKISKKLPSKYINYNIYVNGNKIINNVLDKKLDNTSGIENGENSYLIYEGKIDKLSELTVKVGMWVSYEDITNEYMNSGFVGTMKVYIESK
ncbi:MAG: hypothetical protein SO167_03100 [Bacilli bacterium]|nr:hypothetical protein [Bacilli bacterium]